MNHQIPFAQSILHTTDFSPASHQAFAHALAIAILRQADLTVLHCGPESAEDVDWQSFPQVRQTLTKWGLFDPDGNESAEWQRLKINIQKRSVKSEHPVLATVKFLQHSPHDLVVLATESGQGLEWWPKLSTAENITRFSRTNTLFVPSAARRGLIDLDRGSFSFLNVLVPVDHTPKPHAAIEYAQRAVEMLGDEMVTITILHVGDTLPDMPGCDDGERWRWKIDQRQGDAKTVVLDYARNTQADLIVMASAGADTVLDVIQGSTAERVLRESKCPVLVVAST